MSFLLNALTRLAYENEEAKPHVLPILKRAFTNFESLSDEKLREWYFDLSDTLFEEEGQGLNPSDYEEYTNPRSWMSRPVRTGPSATEQQMRKLEKELKKRGLLRKLEREWERARRSWRPLG